MTSSKTTTTTTTFGYVANRIAVSLQLNWIGQTKHFRLQGCLGICVVVLLRDSFVAKEWNRDG